MLRMFYTTLLAEIDEEIAKLQEVKRLLIGNDGVKRGHKPVIAPAFKFGANKTRKKRVLSAAATARIRAAQKARWAEWHKTHPRK